MYGIGVGTLPEFYYAVLCLREHAQAMLRPGVGILYRRFIAIPKIIRDFGHTTPHAVAGKSRYFIVI
jgi:hypothetical protein